MELRKLDSTQEEVINDNIENFSYAIYNWLLRKNKNGYLSKELTLKYKEILKKSIEDAFNIEWRHVDYLNFFHENS